MAKYDICNDPSNCGDYSECKNCPYTEMEAESQIISVPVELIRQANLMLEEQRNALRELESKVNNFVTKLHRMTEIATLLKDGFLECDEMEALEFMRETVEMTPEEAVFFGVDFSPLNIEDEENTDEFDFVSELIKMAF